MDMLKKLRIEEQVVLGGAVLYLIDSFFDWQQVSAFGFKVGVSEWTGVGVIAGLFVVALLLWEAARLFKVEIPLGSLTPGLVSVALALLLLLFTVITFLSHNEFRHWPSWVGFLLSIAIAAAAVVRAKTEGVEMADLSKIGGGQGYGGSSKEPGETSPPASSESESPPQSPAPGGDAQA